MRIMRVESLGISGFLGASLLVLVCGCSTTEPQKRDSKVVGVFERTDVAGTVVKIEDHIPVDGGVLVFVLENRDGDMEDAHVRGPSLGLPAHGAGGASPRGCVSSHHRRLGGGPDNGWLRIWLPGHGSIGAA